MKHKSIIEARNFFIIVMIIGINLILRCFIMKSAIVKKLHGLNFYYVLFKSVSHWWNI